MPTDDTAALGLLRAGKLPPSVALVISLSMLTLVAMVGCQYEYLRRVKG